MKQAQTWMKVGLLLFWVTSTALTCRASEPLPAETLVTRSIDPMLTSRIYVSDVAINHISDGRLRVFDALNGKLLGMISTAYAGNYTVVPQKGIYVATTHFSRSTRGERTDVLEVYDSDHLAFQYEVVLPTKRAQTLNYRGLVRTNSTGQWVYVQNATPATSITVVDLSQRKVLNEIATPGCWGVLPAASHPFRISMLCGDGKVATLTLNEQGQVVQRQTTAKLFDADDDAWFHHAEQVGDSYWFVSFKGLLTQLNLGSEMAQVVRVSDLVSSADKRKGWRPGGYQLFAVNPTGDQAIFSMHSRGAEGSHKRPAEQLWTFDLQTGKRLGVTSGHNAIAMTISKDNQRLHVVDGESGALRVFQWSSTGPKKLLSTIARSGEAPSHIESND